MIVPALLGGLLVGVSLGLLGSGGSILTVPILVYGLGHPEKTAIAESLVIVAGIAAIGSTVYLRTGDVCWKTVMLFGLPGIAGTMLGALLASAVSGSAQLVVFGVVMLFAATSMLRTRPDTEDGKPGSNVSASLQGLGVGLLTGFVGVGGGFLIVPALVLLRRMPLRRAVGTSLVVIAINATVGFIGYNAVLPGQPVAWTSVALFLSLGGLGTVLGGRMHSRINPRHLRRAFAAVLVVIGSFIVVNQSQFF
jgi:uncharacterized membrane protein YfcA